MTCHQTGSNQIPLLGKTWYAITMRIWISNLSDHELVPDHAMVRYLNEEPVEYQQLLKTHTNTGLGLIHHVNSSAIWIQWGSENWTCTVFKWFNADQFTNVPVSKWHSKTGCFCLVFEWYELTSQTSSFLMNMVFKCPVFGSSLYLVFWSPQ